MLPPHCHTCRAQQPAGWPAPPSPTPGHRWASAGAGPCSGQDRNNCGTPLFPCPPPAPVLALCPGPRPRDSPPPAAAPQRPTISFKKRSLLDTRSRCEDKAWAHAAAPQAGLPGPTVRTATRHRNGLGPAPPAPAWSLPCASHSNLAARGLSAKASLRPRKGVSGLGARAQGVTRPATSVWRSGRGGESDVRSAGGVARGQMRGPWLQSDSVDAGTRLAAAHPTPLPPATQFWPGRSLLGKAVASAEGTQTRWARPFAPLPSSRRTAGVRAGGVAAACDHEAPARLKVRTASMAAGKSERARAPGVTVEAPPWSARHGTSPP